MNLILHIDGGSRGNPGPAAAGVQIEADVERPFAVHEAGYFLGRMTNNVAEYTGLLRGLELTIQLKARSVKIYSDSELMVRQITGVYGVKSPELKPLYHKATRLLAQIPSWKIQHVYREANARADELANMAMDAKRDVIVTSGEAFAGVAKTPAAAPQLSQPVKTTGPVAQAGPRWTAKLLIDPGEKCPARCPSGKAFSFGPSTPAGFCVHAAQAVFDAAPVKWDKTHAPKDEVACNHCGVAIELHLKP